MCCHGRVETLLFAESEAGDQVIHEAAGHVSRGMVKHDTRSRQKPSGKQ